LTASGRQRTGGGAVHGKKGDIDIGEHPGLGLFDGVFLAGVFHDFAGRPRRGKKPQRGQREIPREQKPEQLSDRRRP